jgi:hypothetical protein
MRRRDGRRIVGMGGGGKQHRQQHRCDAGVAGHKTGHLLLLLFVSPF